MSRPLLLLAVGLVGLAGTGVGRAESPLREHRIVVVTPSVSDERLAFFREAVGFWNRSLEDMGLALRLTETATLVAPPDTRAFENYTRRIWQQAGRTRPGMSSPEVPPAILDLEGDVVLFFSAQPTMSFAWPLQGTARYFVAVPREPGSRFVRAGSTRNVIAHELGHTLGLVHHRNSVVLMCSPCRPHEATEDDQGFLPLTALDRERLAARH